MSSRDDYELGLTLGRIILAQGEGAFDGGVVSRSLIAQVHDLVGADTSLVVPLRDLLQRLEFQKLLQISGNSQLIGSRDELIRDISQIYSDPMVRRLKMIIAGCLGEPLTTPPQSLGSLGGSTPRVSKYTNSLFTPSSEPQLTTQSTENSFKGILIAILSMLAGGMFVGLIWVLVSDLVVVSEREEGVLPRPKSEFRREPLPRNESPTISSPQTQSPSQEYNTWGGVASYKFGRLPDANYPHNCAFSQTGNNGKIITKMGKLDFWACRWEGGSVDDGYKVIWSDGKRTIYRFYESGEGTVIGTNGTGASIRWFNGKHNGDNIIVINHEDGAQTWISGEVD